MTAVEGVRIDSDERGFELHVIVDEWPEDGGSGLMILNVQAVAEELFDAVKSSIGPWLQERDAAYLEWQATRSSSDGVYDFELDDPKHPTFHERMADAADHARKVAKGE